MLESFSKCYTGCMTGLSRVDSFYINEMLESFLKYNIRYMIGLSRFNIISYAAITNGTIKVGAIKEGVIVIIMAPSAIDRNVLSKPAQTFR